ncbi:MAG: stage II sporulation protein R [Clostridium sp.]
MMVLEFIKNNKKKVALGLTAVMVVCLAGVFIYNKTHSLNSKVIRFHVLANSDTNIDQTVKIKVKDKVIKYVQPLLKESKSIKESKKILNDNKDKIINIANKELKQNGQVYTSSASIGKFDFPVKSYGDIVFPSGEYDAFRIILGEGQGKNWWCVMFPPLCFVDVKNAVADKEMEKELSKVLTQREMESVNINKKSHVPELKFKSLEIIRNIFK